MSEEMPELILEIGFVTGATTSDYLQIGDPARGLIGTNTLAPADVMTDVTSYLRGDGTVITQRGSSRVDSPVLRYDAGAFEAPLDNTDRRFDPTNLDGPYVSGGRTQVEPMRVVRLRASWSGETYPIWRGFADKWVPAYYRGDAYSDVTLLASDGFKPIARNKRSPVAATGASELSGARVSRILDSVSWPTADRMLDDGTTTLQATTLDGDGLSEIQLVTDTEFGEFYIDRAGLATFRQRTASVIDERSATSQATFGDDASLGELPWSELTPTYDDDQIINEARITRVGGTEQVAEDTDSQDRYLIATHERSDLLMEADPVALSYARHLVYTAKDAEYRFESMVIDPLVDPDNLFPQVLGREIGDRITVKRRPPGGGDPIEREVFIRGIRHEITRHRWFTTWQLQAASKESFLVIGHPTLGLIGSNALSY